MDENKKALDKEQKEQKAIYIENKILSFLLPITGVIALILGLMGLILTASAGQVGITVFYIILLALGLAGTLYGVLLIIRLKKPDFLKRKKKEEVEDSILQD
ncbi:MAG: hypothetical protein IK028_05095 [Bacilli bacterium]|nr:hypothetical protein [Bacilli bacterium]